MKLIKKLTLSITTIACVLSLTACNDDNITKNFKDKGKEVESEEFYSLYNEEIAEYELPFDFVMTSAFLSSTKGVTYITGEENKFDYKSNGTRINEYDSSDNIYKSLNYTKEYDNITNEEESHSSSYLYFDDKAPLIINEMNKTYFRASMETIDNVNIDIDYFFSLGVYYSNESCTFYVNNNIYTVEINESDERYSYYECIQIQMHNNYIYIMIDSKTKMNTEKEKYESSGIMEYKLEFKEVNLDQVDLSEYTFLQ